MLFIQSNNNQERSKLSEEFDRDGNLFGVPFRQSHRIKDIVQQIKYQVFQGYFQPGKLQNKKGVIQMKQLAVKIENFILCMLNLKFSLPTLREIFELIKSQQAKYTFYCNYYEQMSRVIEQETDQQDHKQKYRRLELNVQSEEEEAYNNLNSKSKQILQTYQSSFGFIQHHQNSGRQSEAHVEKIDWELIRSLKSQLPNSPKYVLSAIPDLSVFKAKEQDQQMTSFQVQNTCHKIRDFDALLSTEGSQKKTTNNEYLDSLSGRVHPLPSFLHDENMGQMIAKQKKEDIRKSKILRQAINKQDSSTSTTSNPRGYSASLRAIKLNNKLRKNSRNSISIKDELHREESKKSLYSNTTDCKFFNKASHTSEKELNEKIIKAVQEKQKQMFASQKKCKESMKKCGNFIKSKVIK